MWGDVLFTRLLCWMFIVRKVYKALQCMVGGQSIPSHTLSLSKLWFLRKKTLQLPALMIIVPQISPPHNRQLALASVDHQIRWLHNVSLFLFTLKGGWWLYSESTVEAQRELAKLKADKEERRAIRKKKAIQKANQQAEIETGSDNDFEPRADPLVITFYINVY